MSLTIRTEPITDEDRRSLAAADATPWRPSPVIPAFVAVAGVFGIITAFWIWPHSMEGAAACIFVGASALAAGWWIAHERWLTRRWQAKLRREREQEIARGEVIAVSLHCEQIVPAEYFEDLYTAIFLASPEEYLLVTDAVLLHLPAISSDSYPRALSFRILPKGAVISVTAGSEHATIGPALTDAQRERIFGVPEDDAAEMPFRRIPATALLP